MPTVIERARRYISRCPPAISGQHGHDQTFHVACLLVHGFDLSDADALTLLHEWNASCAPPWSEAELVHKIKSAATASHEKPRGHLLGGVVTRGRKKSGRGVPTATNLIPTRKPKFCPMVLKRIAAKVDAIPNVDDFIRVTSPVRVDSQDSASILRRLYRFGSGEKILIFSNMESQGQFVWEANRSDVIQNVHLPTGQDGV